MINRAVPEPKSLFEKSSPGRVGCNLPKATTPEVDLGDAVGETRKELNLPEIAELDLVRHFTNLSQINYGIDTGFYPLGSCTMKYNPRINEKTAGLPGFTQLHPLQPEDGAPELGQGSDQRRPRGRHHLAAHIARGDDRRVCPGHQLCGGGRHCRERPVVRADDAGTSG